MDKQKMKQRIRIAGFVPICFLMILFSQASAQNCKSLSEEITHGGVLWTQNAVVVQGTAAPGLSKNMDKSVSAIKQQAKRAATIDAYRKLAAVLSGVRVTSESLAADNPKFMTEIQAFVRRAEICKSKYYADGGVDMVVTAPLSNAFSMDKLTAAGSKVANAKSKFTGLVVDASSISFAPALAPRLLAADGPVLFSLENVKKEVLVNRGAVVYANNIETVDPEILGGNPLNIRAIGLGSLSPSDLIIASEPANVLSESPAFLGEGKVVIITPATRNIECKNLAPKVKDALVDWGKRIILASGTGKIDFTRKLETATRIRMLERAAEIDAQRKLLKAFSQIHVSGDTLLKDFPGATRHTMGVVLNAVRCDAKFFRDGTAEVVMAAPIDGMGVKGAELGKKGGSILKVSELNVSGLIVDAIGLKFKPVLAPGLLAPDGTRVFGSNVVAKAYVEHYGVAGYRSSISEATSDRRIGNTPVVVKAINTSGDTGQLTLSAEDAERVEQLKNKTGLLSQGRVIIITENTIAEILPR